MKRQTIPQQAKAMLHVLPAVIAKKRIKPGADGVARVHQGFELNRKDMAILHALRTKKERLNFLANLMREWHDTFARGLIEHGLIHCHVSEDPADDHRIRISLDMRIQV